jgi:PEP-CTERM motif
MTRLKLSRWLAVLSLAIALASSTASVLEADTLNIGGTFHMDQLTGTVGADLAEVFTHDNENTWSLTLFGITQSYEVIDYDAGDADATELITQVHATSFDFGFVGPDADVLNEVISQQLTRSSLGGDLFLELSNLYNYTDFWPGNSFWDVGLLPVDDAAGVSFFARGNKANSAFPYAVGGAWFTAEGGGEGFPLVEPQTIRSQRTSIHDSRPESSGELVSTDDFVDLKLSILNLPGDYNGNGSVDAADYTAWRDAMTAGTSLLNDPTPGVDEDDFLFWRAHFGEALGSGAGAGQAAVPEPSSLALLSIGLPLLVWRNSRRAVTGRMRAGRRFVLTTVTRALAGNDVHSFYFRLPWSEKIDHVAQ